MKGGKVGEGLIQIWHTVQPLSVERVQVGGLECHIIIEFVAARLIGWACY